MKRDGYKNMLNRLSAWFGTRPKTVEADYEKLPPDLPNWPIVKELLQDLQARLFSVNITEQETGWFIQTIYSTIQSERQFIGSQEGHLNRLRLQIESNFKKKLDHNNLWFGMLKYLRKVPADEREKFMYSTLPNIIDIALGIEDCRPKFPVYISRQQHGGSTKLSRQFVCSVVACFFLCLFLDRKRESSKMNIVNFATFFKHLPHPAQTAKLQCILHYFECVIERRMELSGHITFCRKVALPNWMLTFDELLDCDLKLCPIDIHTEGAIEDSGDGSIQVCFGNKSVGGGVLGRSVVQEEIHFSTCPELMAAMLFMENMETNEAILVSGFEQFSSCSGYGDSLEFAGHYTGPDQTHIMVTIDAASYRDLPVSKQYEESSILRDLNKAVIGFSWVPGTDSGAVQPWEVASGDGCTPTAVDVAADIVTSAMTDALLQAAESPIDPQSHHHLCHQYQNPSIQQHYMPEPHHLSCDQQQALKLSEDFIAGSTTSLQTAQHLQQLSPATLQSAAESTCRVQNSLNSAASCSESLQTEYLTSSSSSQQPSVNVSIDSCLVSQPLSHIHHTVEPTTTASNYSAQTYFHNSHYSHIQLLGQPVISRHGEKSQRITPLLSTTGQLIQSSSDSVSDRASQIGDSIEAAAKSSALIRESQSGLTQPHFSRGLVSDALGNLTKAAITSVLDEEDCKSLHSSGQRVFSELSEWHQEQPCGGVAADNPTDIVIDVQVSTTDSSYSAVPCTLPLTVDIGKEKFSESLPSQKVKTQTDDKYDDIINSIDVVLSLPALQSEFDRVGSGLSNTSMVVSVGSQSMSANSAEEEHRQPAADILYINVENSDLPVGPWRSSIDSMLLEPPCSSSPHSSVSSTNISPNTSFLAAESCHLEPPNGFNDVHVSADFLDGLNNHVQQSSRRVSRDFYGELRDFLSSSSSGSRGSGSGGPVSSSNSSWGSRSGSISSHGTNGSTIDYPDFWSHFRRRSSQLSDTMSRRSSSSKHSSDFSTDLEEISEGVPKHDHGVIEEEGNFLSLVADFASHFVSVAVNNGLIVGANMTTYSTHVRQEDEMNASTLSPEILHNKQLNTGLDAMDNIYHQRFVLRTATVNTDKSFLTLSHPEGNGGSEVPPMSSFAQQSLSEENKLEGNKPDYQCSYSSTSTSLGLSSAEPVNKFISISSTHITPAVSSPMITLSHEPIASSRSHHLGGQPSSSHSLDSGFSSAISSVNLTSQHITAEGLSEAVSTTSIINTSGTKLEGTTNVASLSETVSATSIINTSGKRLQGSSSLTTNVASHPLTTESVYQASRMRFVSNLPSSNELELKIDTSAIATENKSIPFSPHDDDDRRLYATLESKTIYLGPENLPQTTLIPQKDTLTDQRHLEPTSSETNAEFIPLHSNKYYKQKEASEMAEPVEAIINISKNKGKLPKSSSTAGKVLGRGLKCFKRQKTEEEISNHVETQSRNKNHVVSATSSRTIDTKIDVSNSSHVDPHSLSGGFAPSKSSLIPKFRDSFKRFSGHSEHPTSSESKSKSSSKLSSVSSKDKQKVEEQRAQKAGHSSSHKSTKAEKLLSKPYKSRYVFSDVAAAPITDKRKKTKAPESETLAKKQIEKKH